ncbi:hypothetical protein AAHC03_09658 [Spirometra sp. Aus1]
MHRNDDYNPQFDMYGPRPPNFRPYRAFHGPSSCYPRQRMPAFDTREASPYRTLPGRAEPLPPVGYNERHDRPFLGTEWEQNYPTHPKNHPDYRFPIPERRNELWGDESKVFEANCYHSYPHNPQGGAKICDLGSDPHRRHCPQRGNATLILLVPGLNISRSTPNNNQPTQLSYRPEPECYSSRRPQYFDNGGHSQNFREPQHTSSANFYPNDEWFAVPQSRCRSRSPVRYPPGKLTDVSFMPCGTPPTDRVDYDHRPVPSHFPPPTPPPSRLPHFPSRQHVEPVPPVNRPQALIPAAASERIASETLLALPGRKSRPPKILFILRGLPGSGKSTLARLIKSKETQATAEESQEATARVLSMDDFFMTEPDDSDVPAYVYEKDMEALYQKELVKLVCRQMDDGFFNFLIVDAVNQRVSEIEELAAQARARNFQVYVVEVVANVSTCIRRSEGRRSKEDILQIHANWEPTPSRFVLVDANSLQQEISSEEVEMDSDSDNVEGESSEPSCSAQNASGPKRALAVDEEDEESLSEALAWGMIRSRWDREDSAERIERLDGLKRRTVHHSASSDLLSMSEYLKESEKQFPERQPGIKRVTWADVEAMRSRNRRRELGFVVGQSSSNLTADDDNDDLRASEALVQIKFF